MSNGESEPPAARGGDAEMAGEPQLNTLESKLAELTKLAALLEEQIAAEEAKNMGDASEELAHARNSVQAMRSAVDQVRSELNTCVDRKSGHKRIPASRVATLTTAIAHVIQVAEQEKTQIALAVKEARSSSQQATVSVAAPLIAAAKPFVEATKKLTVVVGPPRVSAIQCTATDPAPVIHLQHRIERWVASAQRAANEIAESEPVRTVRDYGARAMNEVSEFISAPRQYTAQVITSAKAKAGEMVDTLHELAEEHIAKPVSKAADYVANTTLYKATVKPVVDSTKRAYNVAADTLKSGAEWVVAAPGRAKQWVAGLFTSEPEAPAATIVAKVATKPEAATKPAEPPAKGMLSALSQAKAACITTPLACLAAQASELFNFSAPALPKVANTLISLPPIP